MLSNVELSPQEYKTLLRNDFLTFTSRVFFELMPQAALHVGPYLECIADRLEKCRTGKIKRLIINLPPRYLKSICASVAFPAWVLGHAPSTNIICASYGQDLSDKHARDTRTIMLSDFYKKIFRTRLSGRQAVNDFETSANGTRMATSVGGVLTGRGADIIIIDDPQKPEEAMSETGRKSVNTWFDNSLLSRLNDKENGCIIIIMQRLHQDDLVGHVLEQGAWDVLSFPAIAEEDEIYNYDSLLLGPQVYCRRTGGVLLQERDSIAAFEKIRQSGGEYTFQSQYQQRPIPLGGAIIKAEWLRYYEENEKPDKFDLIFQSWDTANKATELCDYSVCTTWGKLGNKFYLLHVFRKRLDYPDLKRSVRELAARFKAKSVVIEDKASGIQLIQELKREGMYGLTAYEPSDRDKVMRLHAQTAAIEDGRVLLPRAAAWLGDFVTEIMTFPGSKYDDQIDSMAQALDWVQNKRPPRGFFDVG